ncbi:MAG: hypothetical protein JKY32_05330 [Rhizobiales bacterium]|nr:hypothetical protein [Hyphomicrobiales bacterium]
MTNQSKSGHPQKKPTRAERQSAALRENLKRRKDKTRGRASAEQEKPSKPADGI